MPEIDTFLKQNGSALIDRLLKMVEIPGICVDGGPAIREMADATASECDAAGLETRIEETAGHPVVYGAGGPVSAPFTLMLYGHYDVFPVSGQAGWRTDPFCPLLDGDRIYGRGTGDNKGQFLALLAALRWWNTQPGGLPIRVKVILEGEEEAGSRHLPEFVERNRAELNADLCVYSDGPMLAGDQPALLFGARGALVMEFTSTGPAQPLHSGNFGGVAANPIMEMARFFAELVAPNGDLRADGINEGVPVPTPAEQAALDSLEVDRKAFVESTKMVPVTERFGENYYERLLGKPTFNISGIHGGHTGDGFRTLIPTSAAATVDMRLVGTQDPGRVFACIERFIQECGYPGLTVRKVMSQPPSRTPIDHPRAGPVAEALRIVSGREPKKIPSLAGTTPDWVFTAMLGMPSIMVPLAPADENHHGPNESMKISLFMQGVKFYAKLVELLSRPPAGLAGHRLSPRTLPHKIDHRGVPVTRTLTHLDMLEAESIQVIREVAVEFQRPALLFSGGKDSIVMLTLAERAFRPARIPFPVMHVDTGHNFPEVLEFRDRRVAELGVRLVVASVQESIDAGRVTEETGRHASRNRLQTVTLLDTIEEHQFDALFGGARRDEEKARAKERVFSFRDEFGQWDPKNQQPELWNLYNTRLRRGEHVRVFPLSNWTELDIWQYIEREELKLPPVYFAHLRFVFERDGILLADSPHLTRGEDEPLSEALVRYRTVGDMTCTGAVESTADTVAAVIAELASTRITERGQTRADDRASETAMEDRKREGYF